MPRPALLAHSMRVHVGTSGYNYPAWKGRFYPQGLPATGWLAYYAERFPTVEMNATFYRIPTAQVFAGWAERTPEGFRFAVKASQRITHQARLKPESVDTTRVFLERARSLGAKLGPVLFQLPPNFKKDAARLRDFLALLPPGTSAAFEFRHSSWFDDEVYTTLRQAGAALCIADTEDLSTPVVATAAFGYLRLRREDYDEAAIAAWAERIRTADFGDDVFVYFKHEDEAKGVDFAARLAKRFASSADC
jgi:uncharacterized protein YecE (DUF72 family)